MEADKILGWLKREINETWKRRKEITPRYGVAKNPQPIEILKLLPKTNCKKCHQPTCLVFATLIAQGAKGVDDCLQIDEQDKMKLTSYLSRFNLAEINPCLL